MDDKLKKLGELVIKQDKMAKAHKIEMENFQKSAEDAGNKFKTDYQELQSQLMEILSEINPGEETDE